MHVYRVQPGDTLTELARRYRVTPGQLALCNDLPPSSLLLPGLVLCIPSELEVAGTEGYTTYEVQPGDTPRQICADWQIPCTWLAVCNQLQDPYTLQPGAILLLPHTAQHVPIKPDIRLLSLTPLRAPTRQAVLPVELARPHLRVDAAGHVHFPSPPPQQEASREQQQLLICSLDGAANILPDVGKAILRSEQAKQRILDTLAARLRSRGGAGVIFAWHPLRPEAETAYLEFVREAGRRLRPMGLRVGVYLAVDTPWRKRRRLLETLSAQIDDFFFDPAPCQAQPAGSKPPAPLIGLQQTRRALQELSASIPLSKTWLLLHPIALVCQQDRVVERLSVRQALQLAVAQGAPLCHDEASALAWFRCHGGDGSRSVWLEDLESLVKKLELVRELQLQGSAVWETDLDFPAAWQYLGEHYRITSPAAETKKGSVS